MLLSVWMTHKCAGLHLGDISHHIKTRAKTGTEISCVEGVVLLLSTGVTKVKFQCICVCVGGLLVGREGVIVTGGGMESSDVHGCFLVLALSLGGAGTHSKHFPEDRKSKQKQNPPATNRL